jgi:hypothetical protein
LARKVKPASECLERVDGGRWTITPRRNPSVRAKSN